MKKLWSIVGIGVGISVVVSGVGMLGFERKMDATREQLAAGGTVIETACGPIEYAERGEGQPVLLLHGAGGGYDQGLLLGERLLGDGYRLIAPSRFGYLGSPVPDDHSLEAQADAYACLLDELGIGGSLPVVAFSAGGPSGLTFALRHPERTSALVMVSAISYMEPSTESSQIEVAINRMVSSDLVYWLSIKLARKQVVSLLGIPPETQASLGEADQATIDRVLDAMLPMSARLDGIGVDQSNRLLDDLPWENIDAPTLVIHARDDALIGFEVGEYAASHVPGARFFPVETGGHFLAGQYEVIQEEIVAF
jgi:2-hydroxy-6-oxonona-2,4-dienedioate hydrolase